MNFQDIDRERRQVYHLPRTGRNVVYKGHWYPAAGLRVRVRMS